MTKIEKIIKFLEEEKERVHTEEYKEICSKSRFDIWARLAEQHLLDKILNFVRSK